MEEKKRRREQTSRPGSWWKMLGPISALTACPRQDPSPVAGALQQLHFSFTLVALITVRQLLFLFLLLPSPCGVEACSVPANKP